MTDFFWCLEDEDKESALLKAVTCVRNEEMASNIFVRDSLSFKNIPGSAFSYWAPESAILGFIKLNRLETEKRIARSTNDSGDDFRFIRAWWEINVATLSFVEWRPLCKGGEFSRYYSDIYLTISWNTKKESYHGFVGSKHRPLEKPASADLFLRPGLTWSRRTNLPLSVRAMPAGCNFAQKGPAIFFDNNSRTGLLSTLAIVNSSAFFYFVDFLCAAVGKSRAYDMGLLQNAPFPDLSPEQEGKLSSLAYRGWLLKKCLSSVNETSHAFLLPEIISEKILTFRRNDILRSIDGVQSDIDKLSIGLFGLDESAFHSNTVSLSREIHGDIQSPDEEEDSATDEDDEISAEVDQKFGLLSWAVGVAFGRFDWRLATGEREAPPEPDPFDRLPIKSPGMLPDCAAPFHLHNGILVGDQGHKHDLPRLIEEVLTSVNIEVPGDIRRWLQRDFFSMHLKQYSKSRRKAPIYWPISTVSGGYTCWLYYPSLTSQTLYTVVNDFIEPKLVQIGRDAAELLARGSARSREDDRGLEMLQDLERELVDLRDRLVAIAPTYRPNHDDGVQITAAPLWELFRHRSWAAVLRATWSSLQSGEYDWSYLAMAYWPDRVREKCKTDKSLAIAHDLERLYVPPEPKAAKPRGRKKASEA